MTVTLEVQITALPPNGIISNEANVTYTSQPDPTLPPITTTTPTPIAETIVQNAELESTKTVDLPIANIGDALTYTITLENTGNIPMTNVSVIDQPPVGTQFIVDSVTVNGLSQPGVDPSIGILIGTIQPNQIITITFQVTITNIPLMGLLQMLVQSTLPLSLIQMNLLLQKQKKHHQLILKSLIVLLIHRKRLIETTLI